MSKLLPFSLIMHIALSSCQGQPSQHSFHFLEGTWKVEGKEQFEQWERKGDQQLVGSSYNMRNGEKIVTETLLIEAVDGHTTYYATVPNQNDGQTIPFVLNPLVSDTLSFENLAHDFPQRIQYVAVSNDELLVKVLGPQGKGFGYGMKRVN